MCKNRKWTTAYGFDYCLNFEMGECDGTNSECSRYEEGEEDEYCPSCTAGDYSPSCPWNAPGMSVRDFI